MSVQLKENESSERVVTADNLKAGCPMAALLEMLTRPWTLHILWLLSQNGPMRFGALKRAAEGISARLLTLRLRTLEAEGFVERKVVPGKITQVSYAPTQRLLQMDEVMRHLNGLSEQWRTGADASPEANQHSQAGGPHVLGPAY